MAVDKAALATQIAADPRVQEVIAKNRRGSLPVYLDATALRALGYEVPDDWKYTSGNRDRGGRMQPTLFDERDGWDKGLMVAGAAVLTAGALGLAGVGPLGGGAAGPSAGLGTSAVPTGVTAPTVTSVASGFGGTLLRYGLQYGLPIAGNLIASKMAADAQRAGDKAMAGYYDRALDAELEEQRYRRGWDEEDRRYGRYSDSYGREDSEERLRYGRAGDTYGRESDEERLWYDRAQDIRDKNYGYQQYGNFVETLEPFRASGSAAVSRMSGLLGGPTPQDTGSYLNLANTARNSVQAVPNVPDRPTWSYSGTRPTWNYESQAPASSPGPPADPNAPVSTSMPVDHGTGLVLMQAPDGSQRQIPAAQVPTFERMGAVRLA